MKTFLFAAAAVIAMPALAQTTPPTNQPGGMASGQSGMSDATQPNNAPPPTTTPATDASGSGAMSGQPMAGQPMAGQPMAGQPTTFQQPQDVNTAFPPPPAKTGPLPYCKAGQYDGCREHSTGSGARSHKTPR